MTVTDAALNESASPNDAPIDVDLIRGWLAWGLGWLLLFATLGGFVSTKLTYPTFLGDAAWFTYGRLRPIHVNGVIWGAFSTLFIGLCYYVVPRLTGVRIWGERWGHALLWVWNLNLAAAVVLLALGWNRGWEMGELPLVNVLVALAAIGLLTAQLLITIKRRRDRCLQVSLCYLLVAFVWTHVTLVLLMLGPAHIRGLDNAAWHGLFVHYMVGLWITPAGYALIYYFLPASVKGPLYSQRLAWLGFWSLALLYPFVRLDHYPGSPLAGRPETTTIVSSIALAVPAWTVLHNVVGTMRGRWRQISQNLPARFLIVGALMHLVGTVQGTLEAFRSVQQTTHFTDFGVAHSHLTIFGTFVMWAIAATVYVWSRLANDPALWSLRVANWSFWLVTLGISAMALVLTAQGLQQGFMLMAGAEWVRSVDAIRPYWWARTFTGFSINVGLSLLVYTLMKTSLARPA